MSILRKPRTPLSSFRLIATFAFSASLIFIGMVTFSTDGRDLNLLIITVDTLRADHVGIYGYEKINTPHIDNLGKNGVLFAQAFCHVPLTLPSHCSLFTGTLPIFHGVRDNGYRMPPFNITLAEIYKQKGYKTAAFVGAFPLDSRFGLDKGFDVYDDLYGSRNVVRDLSFIERRAEEVNKKAIAWIDRNKNERFFVWVHYFDPHAPYEPPPPFKNEYSGREYDGEIAYTDTAIGELLGKLHQLKLTENTLLILTSDHGEGLGEHQEKTHGIFIYDSTLRVPLIFHNPKIFSPGTVISEQVSLVDVMPTVLDLMKFSQNPEIQGNSLKPIIFNGKSYPEKFCYIESVAAMMDRNWAPLQGIRTENFKYIEAPIEELYHLRNDPREEKNILKEKPEIVQQLRQELRKTIKSHTSPVSSYVFKTKIDEETREKLMALGYVSGRTIRSDAERPDPKTMIELDNLFNDAIIASETGKMETARLMYDKVLQKQPNFIIGYEYASYNYYKMGKLIEAINLLENAVDHGLTSTSLLSKLGMYYQEAGKLKESMDVLEKAIQQDKNYAEAHNYLGVSYYKDGQIEKSIDSFKTSIAIDNDYAMALNNLGNCFLAQKQYDLSIDQYKKAIVIDENLASAVNGLAVAFYRKGVVDEALLNWEKSLKIDAQQADTLYNLGRVYLRLGQKKKALYYLELFTQTAPPLKYKKDLEEVRQVIDKLKAELETAKKKTKFLAH